MAVEQQEVAARPPRWRERAAGYGADVRHAWRLGPVRRGFAGSCLLFVGSLTPAYLPQNSPWWDPIRALGLDNWPGKVLGTALVVAAVALLVEAWFALRPSLYVQVKHWAIFLLWSLPLVFAPPIFSHDAYSYAAQGWLLYNGLNPYETSVSVLPGAFADQVAWLWRYTPAPYGPLSLQLSHALVVAVGLNPYLSAMAMRIPALIGVALIVHYLPRLAHRVKADAQMTAWFSTINPLLIIDFVGGAHNDALMMGLILLALWLAFEDRFWLAAVVVGVAAAIKQPAFLAAYPVALIGHPWLSFAARDTMRALGRVAASSAVAIGTFAAISVATGLNFGWINAVNVPGMVVTLAPFTLVGAGVKLVLDAVGPAGWGDVALAVIRGIGLGLSVIVVAWLALTVGRRKPLTFLGWSYLAVAFGGPALHSWYLMWGGLLLPLTHPSERIVRTAVTVTTVLLAYGAGNLAWRNDAVALGFAAIGLMMTLLYRHIQHRKEHLAAERSA